MLLSAGASDRGGVVSAAPVFGDQERGRGGGGRLGTQSVALEGVHYLERRVPGRSRMPSRPPPARSRHCGAMVDQPQLRWRTTKGQLVVNRMIGSGTLLCKEIVFSVDTKNGGTFTWRPYAGRRYVEMGSAEPPWRWVAAVRFALLFCTVLLGGCNLVAAGRCRGRRQRRRGVG